MRVRLSRSLSYYIGRQFLIWAAIVMATFVVIVFLASFTELMARSSGKPDVTFDVIMHMALLHLPYLAQESIPFAILFGGLMAFWRLNRSHELVAVRAAGVSVWQFTLPAIAVALAIGVLKLTAINPVGALMLSQFEQLEHKYLTGRTSLLAVSSTGVWMRQSNEQGQAVIHASRADAENMKLDEVIVLVYEGQDHFVRRIDADSARLFDGYWELYDAEVREAETEPGAEAFEVFRLPTDLTEAKIVESFASPETISFWELPGFINVLEETGFSAQRHRLHLNSLLAEPLLLCAMILIAAVFSLRHTRRSGVFMAVAGGVLVGFGLFLASKFVLAVASSGAVPVALAAWTPALATTLIGLATLLHLEDG